jgi:xylulokinase
LLDLRAGTPVAAGAADAAAAALGSRLVDPGTVQLTIGTGSQIVRPVTTLPTELPTAPVTHLYRAATDKGWYAMGAGLNGGSTLAWVCRTLDASWQQLYATAVGEPRQDDPFFLPHLHGERTPYLDPDMRGAWIGLAPHHHRDHLLRAALEGVAFAIRDALEATLTPENPAPHLRLAGGGTTDPGWRQMLADVLGHPISAFEESAASGLGAATLAARAADLVDEDTALARTSATRPVAQPGRERPEIYSARYRRYRETVRALRRSGDHSPER